MVACALIPRLSLLAAAGGRAELLRQPVALAPEPGGAQVIGETSGPAEAFGVRAGMRLGEALARCPELVLAPPDPERAGASWEEALRSLEGIGAAVEPGRPGEAFFEAAGLRGLWGGSVEGVLRRAREAVGPPARLGAGPSRLCAYAAAQRARRRRSVVVPEGMARSFVAALPVGILRDRLHPAPAALGCGAEEAAGVLSADLPEKLERLGPAASLGLRALETGPEASDQASLEEVARGGRRKRLAEAVRQARAVAGGDAVLRVLDVEEDSRVPERRLLLTPYTYADDSSATPPGSSG